MLDKIQRQSRIVEQLAKNTMTGDAENTDDWPGNDGEDAMGVNIGDHVHYHYPPQETPTASEPQDAAPSEPPHDMPPQTTQQPAQPKSNFLKNAAVAAALLVGGAGMGFGLSRPSAPTPLPSTTTIENTQDLGVGVEVIPEGATE